MLKKHGAELIGFWTPQDDKDGKGSKLIYLVAFPSREAAAEDLEGLRRRPRVEEGLRGEPPNGVLVNKVESVFLDPTDYSAMK